MTLSQYMFGSYVYKIKYYSESTRSRWLYTGIIQYIVVGVKEAIDSARVSIDILLYRSVWECFLHEYHSVNWISVDRTSTRDFVLRA